MRLLAQNIVHSRKSFSRVPTVTTSIVRGAREAAVLDLGELTPQRRKETRTQTQSGTFPATSVLGHKG